jgi:hypothetical protein
LIIKSGEIIALESFGEQHSRRRRLRMKLVTHPGIINSVFFLQLVDNALADIAEGSDIVGKYFEVDHDLGIFPR